MRDNFYGDIELGPALDEDINFLQAIIKMIVPKTVVEFGYFWGKSANAMLEVLSEDAVLHSFDNTKDPIVNDHRFKFYCKSQEQIDGIENIDFVFLDASHDLELNKKTFEKLIPLMSEQGIIAVHDTGKWVGGNVFNASIGEPDEDGNWIHCIEELQFIDWIKEKHPDWQIINFHSLNAVRHGITLLQKYKKLL